MTFDTTRSLVRRMAPRRLRAQRYLFLCLGLWLGLFVSTFASVAACSGPATPDGEEPVSPAAARRGDDLQGAVVRLSSRFRRERKRALSEIVAAGKDGLGILKNLLDSEDVRLRLLAATGLGEIKRPEARSALLVRLTKEDDPMVFDRVVDSLVVYGADAWAVIKTRGKSEAASARDKRAYDRFLWQYSIDVVQRILKENTNASGDFKGFYDGQFEDLVKIGPETGRVMVEIMNDRQRFPLSLRQIAVRAMGEVGGRDSIPALLAFHKAMSDRLGIDDPMRHPEPERVLKIYARYVLARFGETAPSFEQIQYLRRRMFAERQYRRLGSAALYQWELAYEYHQIRNFPKAIEEYHRYLNDFPIDKLDLGNSRHIAYYNLCCIQSLRAGQSEAALEAQGLSREKLQAQALRYLEKAFEAHYTDFYWLSVDRDLDAIRKLPAFAALIAKHRAKFIPKFEGTRTPEIEKLEEKILALESGRKDLEATLAGTLEPRIRDSIRLELDATRKSLQDARTALRKLTQQREVRKAEKPASEPKSKAK